MYIGPALLILVYLLSGCGGGGRGVVMEGGILPPLISTPGDLYIIHIYLMCTTLDLVVLVPAVLYCRMYSTLQLAIVRCSRLGAKLHVKLDRASMLQLWMLSVRS